jgi:hypothetical protein
MTSRILQWNPTYGVYKGPASHQNLKEKLIHGNGDRKNDYPFASGFGIFLLQLNNLKANKCGHVLLTMPPISKCDLVMYFAWPLLLENNNNATSPKHDVVAKLDFQ